MPDSMLTVFTRLFDTSSFPARWHCGEWTPALGWTHILADLAICGAYLAIPCLIFFFVLRRPDVPFPSIMWLFGAFIVMCGLTHLVESIIFWHPVYRFSALMKVGTAAVSWATVAALVPVIPQALRYPGLESMNRRLQEANRELEEFSQIVSHDLRAPLRGIRRLSGWVAEGVPDAPAEVREHLDMITSRIDRMDHLIDRVLMYSRAGRAPLQRGPVETAKLLQEVVQTLPPEQRERVKVEGDFPRVHADEIHLYQVFLNLIDNALRYIPEEGGEVRIAARKGDRMHVFSVEDNGPGVPEALRENLFQIFTTGESADSVHAGLGLCITRRVIERNGGKIWHETPAGGGSRFRFAWPADGE